MPYQFVKAPSFLLIILLHSFEQSDAKIHLSGMKNAPDSIPVTDTSESKTLGNLESEAEFPGGAKGWRNYLEQNLNARIPLDNGAPKGKYTVWVQFIIDKDGSVSQIIPLTNYGYGMEAEVARIMRLAPKWVPAEQNGKAVKAYRKQPVTFFVQGKKRKRTVGH